MGLVSRAPSSVARSLEDTSSRFLPSSVQVGLRFHGCSRGSYHDLSCEDWIASAVSTALSETMNKGHVCQRACQMVTSNVPEASGPIGPGPKESRSRARFTLPQTFSCQFPPESGRRRLNFGLQSKRFCRLVGRPMKTKKSILPRRRYGRCRLSFLCAVIYALLSPHWLCNL